MVVSSLLSHQCWDVITHILPLLPSLNEISMEANIAKASFQEVTAMIFAFPKIDWISALWKEEINGAYGFIRSHVGMEYPAKNIYMEFHKDSPGKKPLYIYSFLSTKG